MTGRVVTAKGSDHVWHLDLTIVPTVSGFWAPWLPFALPQSWPFCWWVAIAIDHYSRRLMFLAVFPIKPDSRTVCRFLESVLRCAGSRPKYLVCDKNKVFWCQSKGVKPRYGAVGEHGSIAVVERALRTVKNVCTRRILVFSSLLQAMLPAQTRRPKIAGPLHPHDRILDLGCHSGSFPGSATCGLVGACRLIIKQSACGMALRGFDLIVEVLATRLVRIHRVLVRMS